MPAYSSTPLAQKLGIKDASRYLLVGAPAGFARELPTVPKTAVALSPRARHQRHVVRIEIRPPPRGPW